VCSVHVDVQLAPRLISGDIAMNHIRTTLPFVLCAAAALFTTGASAQAKMVNGMLVNTSGMTLYTFDKDTAGKSACVGACAALWPPAMAMADAKSAGDYSMVTRDDGAKQWAYQGKPLYTYSMDKKAGDATGDNFKEIWHVVK
jgi:predicted lipoprotein with Yx(FWY)xxD motif